MSNIKDNKVHGTAEVAGQSTASCSVPEFHKKCHDCGQFLERKLWVAKDHRWKQHALCTECFSNYDDPRNM
jgi:hypothetical protein